MAAVAVSDDAAMRCVDLSEVTCVGSSWTTGRVRWDQVLRTL